jgi:hypothetical protein
MATRTITALFDSRAEAERAALALASEVGLDRASVRVEGAAGAGAAASSQDDKGLLASLRDLFIPTRTATRTPRGCAAAGAMVSARVDDARIDHAMDVLERHGAVDLDAREAAWRREGWTGGAGAAGIVGASSDGERTGVAAMPGAAAASSAPDGAPGNPPGTMLSRGVDRVAGTNVSGVHPEHEARGTAAAGMAGATAGAVRAARRRSRSSRSG